ncbi:MAG: hypothetical protein KDA84_29210, partial [Planctomycetaceae bacterium]|nr:hypothetical protein [Planctomycetaceae bacterium]
MLRGLSPLSSATNWTRILTLFLLVGTVTTTMTVLTPQPVQAQDEGEETTSEEEGDKPEAAQENFLGWMIRASGFFGLILLLLSFVMVALIMMNVLQVRRDNLLPPAFIEHFEQMLANKDYQAAYETAKSDDSFVARVLAAGLSKLNRGYDEAIEGMQE